MEAVHEVEKFVEKICDEYSIYNNYYSNILVSLTEAFENAVKHGNQGVPGMKVKVSFENHSEGLMFKVSDQGDGYDPMTVPDPTMATEADADAGRGLFLMRALSDDIQFENNASTVCLLFKVSSINRELSEHRIKALHAYLHAGVEQHLQN
jgi:serine/threonine-protein kinase RsbW